jgi:predicted Zn-dependent protease with MMP-like domain
MDSEAFGALVEKAVRELPEFFREKMDNIDVVVADLPTRAQLRTAGVRNGTLLGLYEGVPLTQRDSHYGLVAPDKITLFQLPIESECPDESCINEKIDWVLKHEIAHHFGISDDRLREMGRY